MPVSQGVSADRPLLLDPKSPHEVVPLIPPLLKPVMQGIVI